MFYFYVTVRRPPISTRTDTLLPGATLFWSCVYDAWVSTADIDCISLQLSRWIGVDLKNAGKPDPEPNSMAIKRGTVQQFDGHSGLLWTRGPSPVGVGGTWFSSDGKSLPRPIVFTRRTGYGAINLLAADHMALSQPASIGRAPWRERACRYV